LNEFDQPIDGFTPVRLLRPPSPGVNGQKAVESNFLAGEAN
jgi:hypothetical protein